MSKSIDLVPYLHFGGDCEEALNTYARILEGKVEVVNRYDNPAMKAPDHYKNKILHAVFRFGAHTVYASDVFPNSPATRGTADTALSIAVEDPEEGRKIFGQLAEGGEVKAPYEKQFWGAWHGNLKDRFGIRWMVNCE